MGDHSARPIRCTYTDPKHRIIAKSIAVTAAKMRMRAEYDFSGGVRGKYAEGYRSGTNVVLLDPDLVEAFPDSQSVNDALRAILAIARRTDRLKNARTRERGIGR